MLYNASHIRRSKLVREHCSNCFNSDSRFIGYLMICCIFVIKTCNFFYIMVIKSIYPLTHYLFWSQHNIFHLHNFKFI